MKKYVFILIFTLFNLSVIAQNNNSLVTKTMSDKIAKECLYGKGYARAIFYESNKEFLSSSDILSGKGKDILNSLYKYPKYSENFIRRVYKIWGYDGLKNLGFTDKEIILSKKIINKPFK